MKQIVPAVIVLCVAAFAAIPASAQSGHAHGQIDPPKAAEASSLQSPYADRTTLEIKALTAGTIEQYRTGKGMGLAIPAELNGYPGPRHVLDLSAEIELTAGQRAEIESIYESMRVEAVRLGTEIVDLEATLDRDFASGAITPAKLDKLTSEIAVRQGKLRFTHLQAHIATKALLSASQVAAYNKARGY